MIRRPPRSPLFPYPTLFHSISNLMGTHVVASMVVFEGGAPKKSDYRRFRIRDLEPGQPDDFAAMGEVLSRRAAQFAKQREDRKSTRLNSSHANISYAVFCLK